MNSYRTALITGATSGFGHEIAVTLAKLGIHIIATGRRLERLEQLHKGHPNITPFQLDVTDQKQVEDLHARLIEQDLLPDILINNAGLALGLEPADQVDINDWETMIDTNIKGLLYCTRTFTPNMRKNNFGYVINIGSTAGNWPYPGGNTYGATKAFVTQFSRNLRSDFAGTDIRVTCLEPGMAETEFSMVRFKGEKEKADKLYEGKKPLVASDIASIIGFLISLPRHVNVNTLEVMPTCQSWAPLIVTK